MPELFFNFDLYLLVNRLILILVISVSLFMGLWIFAKNKRNRVNQLFFVLSVLFTLWPTFGYLTFFATDELSAYQWIKLAYASVSLFTVTLYFFFYYFLNKKSFSKIFTFFVVMGGIVFVVLSLFTNAIVKQIILQRVGIIPIFGVEAYVFYIYVLIVFIYIFAQLFRGYATADRAQRLKIQYFVIGTSIFLILNTIFNIIIPIIFGRYYLHQFGNYAAIFFLGFTAYAIVKHELFNIEAVTTEVFTVILLIILFTNLFSDQSRGELFVDLIVFIFVMIFSILLTRSVIKEVDQRKKLEELTRRLKELDERKDEFLSIVAHELRAPLTAVKGYVSMILDGDAGDVGDKTRDFLFDVNSSNDRMIRLVNNMLDMSRIEENRIVYQISDVQLREILEEVHREFKFEADRAKIELKLEVPDTLKDYVRVDKDRLHEVLSNFISNGIKYTEQGYVLVKATNPSENIVKVEVVDTGRGIPKVDQQSLFQKFYRAESEKTKSTGTGLGLYVSKLLIESFKGSVGVVSSEGKGSTFWFELPLVAG